MAVTLDQWGCPVTAEPAEMALLEATTVDFVTMSPAIATRLEPLAAGGPLARAVLAQLLTQAHRPAHHSRARELSAAARSEAGDVSPREQGHIDAAWHWSRGDIGRTIAAFDRVLADHPTDLHALRSRYLLQFTTGRLADMAAGVGTARPAWHRGLPLASHLDGMESFGLEETGHYRRAEELGRRGVEQDPGDLWAIHAVAHVLEMEGRRPEGVAWIDAMPGLAGRPGFAGHLWWHQALALIALGRHDDALASFDRHVYPGASEEGLDLTNATSLLARLEAAGLDVGDRWHRVAEPALAHVPQHSQPFNDTHYLLALSRAGRATDCEAVLATMAEWSTRPDDHAAEVLRRAGLDVGRALVAYGQGRWTRAVELLEPVAGEVWRLGGSHAQRQLYTLVLATARSRASA